MIGLRRLLTGGGAQSKVTCIPAATIGGSGTLIVTIFRERSGRWPGGLTSTCTTYHAASLFATRARKHDLAAVNYGATDSLGHLDPSYNQMKLSERVGDELLPRCRTKRAAVSKGSRRKLLLGQAVEEYDNAAKIAFDSVFSYASNYAINFLGGLLSLAKVCSEGRFRT